MAARADQPQPAQTPQSQAVLPSLLSLVEEGLVGEVRAWVAGELRERTQVGVERYGVALHTHNGRLPLVDAEQEALDLLQYIQQAILERRDAGGDERRLVRARGLILGALVELGLDDRLRGGVAEGLDLGRFGVRSEILDGFGRSEAGGAP